MKMLFAITLLLVMAQPAIATTVTIPRPSQDAVSKAVADLKGPIAELSDLDKSDKDLAASKQVQADTTEMLDRDDKRLREVDYPALNERIDQFNAWRQRLIDSSCPLGGGLVPVAVYNRCNPQVLAMNAFGAQTLEIRQTLRTREATIANGRDAVAAKTLADERQQKANDALRETLEKQRAAAQRALAVLLKSFPTCSIGDGSVAALESVAECMSKPWDGGGGHAALAVDGRGTPFFWNAKVPGVKGYHDQYLVYANAQRTDEALLRTLESQTAGPGRDMRIFAVKQRMDGRSQKMNFLKYQATTK